MTEKIKMDQQSSRNYDGTNLLKNQFLSSSSENEDGLLDEILVEIVPGSKWRKRDIAMGIVCSVTAITVCFFIVRTLYQCCCSRNYATWRTKWSLAIKSHFRRGNKKKSHVYNLVDAVPIKFNAHEEDIEHVSATTDSPLVASYDMQGDILILDVLSGECHTRIKRSNSILIPDHHRRTQTMSNDHPRSSLINPDLSPLGSGQMLNDSISSDSTNRSSPSTGSIDNCPFEVNPLLLQSSTLSGVRHGAGKVPVGTNARSMNHRRHHSMGSIPAQKNRALQFSATGSPLPPPPESVDHSNNRTTYSRPQNTSREVLTDLMRSAYYSSSTNLCAMNVITANHTMDSPLNPRAIWSMEMFGHYVFLGCEKGRIEVWHCLSGQLAYFNDEKTKTGITVIKANNTRLVVGYLDGNMEIYQREPKNGKHFFQRRDKNSSTSSHSSECDTSLNYNLVHSVHAHLQPITTLQMDGFHIVTGSLDHVIKVFAQETGNCMYTFNQHFGGITCIVLDQTSSTAISGCQVGQVCLWDLQTGTCIFSIEAHSGSCVSSIIQTHNYFISSASDNKILIWDKYSGTLVHSITQHHSVCKDMVLLAANVLVTAKEDYLILYDIREGKRIGTVNLSSSTSIASSPSSSPSSSSRVVNSTLSPSSSSPLLSSPSPSSSSSNILTQGKSYIKNLKVSSQNRAVVCDLGSQVCVIHLTEKYD